MDSNGKFWLGINALMVTLLLGVYLIGASYYSDKNKQIVDAIKSGQDPIAVLCALEDTMGNNPTCVILATKEGEK